MYASTAVRQGRRCLNCNALISTVQEYRTNHEENHTYVVRISHIHAITVQCLGIHFLRRNCSRALPSVGNANTWGNCCCPRSTLSSNCRTFYSNNFHRYSLFLLDKIDVESSEHEISVKIDGVLLDRSQDNRLHRNIALVLQLVAQL